MNPDSPSVPFYTERDGDSEYTSTTIEGVARVEPDALVLEFVEKTRGIAGGNVTTRTSDGTRLRIPYAAVESVEYKRRFFLRHSLHIRVRELGLLDRVAKPGRSECSLLVHRKDVLAAREVAVSVMLVVAEVGGAWRV